MPTLAERFKTCYLTGGSGVEFSEIRLHYRGVDEICRAVGATALTVGIRVTSTRSDCGPSIPAPRRCACPAAGWW